MKINLFCDLHFSHSFLFGLPAASKEEISQSKKQEQTKKLEFKFPSLQQNNLKKIQSKFS